MPIMKARKIKLEDTSQTAFSLHLCSTRRGSAGASELTHSVGTKAQNTLFVFEVQPRGPEWENKFSQCRKATRWTAWPPSGCPLCFCLPMLTVGLSLSENFRNAEHSTATSLGTVSSQQHPANDCCSPGNGSAVISKPLPSSETSFAGSGVTLLIQLWGLLFHWAEKQHL